MNWRRAIVIGVAIIVVLATAVVGGISLYSDHLYRQSYESHYEYSATFTANQSVENLTVYLPVPVEDGEARVVGANMTAVELTPETTPGDAPPVNATLVQTWQGPMLALTADRLSVQHRYYKFVEEDGEQRRVEISEEEYNPANPEMIAATERVVQVQTRVHADESINTQNPTGTEPLLSPQTNRSSIPCDDPYFETQQCYRYDSRMYATYVGPEDVRTTAWVTLTGQNEWWVFGWNGNEYQDRVGAEFTGPQDGERVVEGELQTGWGSYRGESPTSNRTT